MGVADKFRGLFRGRHIKELANPEKRRGYIEEAFLESRELTLKGVSVTDARRSLDALIMIFREEGHDPFEVFHFAAKASPKDDYWRRIAMADLVNRSSLTDEQLAFMQFVAEQERTNLGVWRRLLSECGRLGNQKRLQEAKVSATMILGAYFPDAEHHLWPEIKSREEAFRFFRSLLDDVTEDVRRDSSPSHSSKMVLKLKLEHDVEDPDTLLLLAQQMMGEGRRDAESAGIGLRALLANPADLTLKLWVAKLLLDNPGYEQEGLELLRQCAQADSENDPHLVQAIRSIGVVREGDLPLLHQHLRFHPDDQRLLELLADFYADRDDISTGASDIYKSAAAQSPKRSRYLRLLYRAQTTQGNWSTVIDILDDLRRSGEEGEDVILPLASAYAEIGRSDEESIEVYGKALRMGCLKREVHDLYCRHLYMRGKDKPDSVTQFSSSYSQFPDLLWARLGMINNLIEIGDHRKALDIATELLRREPRDIEAQKLAAHALASNFSRVQLRKVEELAVEAAIAVLEKAHGIQPDAMPVAETLVRLQLRAGMRTASMEKLLAELCRKNPEALDLRAARADLLHDTGQIENSRELYAQLIERLSASPDRGAALGIGQTRYLEILHRLIGIVLKPPGARGTDLELLLEACTNMDCPTEWVIATGRLLVTTRADHPMRAAILERACALAPEDEAFELALAEAKAQRGNLRPLVRAVAKRLERGRFGTDTSRILHSISAVAKPGLVTDDVITKMCAPLGRKEMDAETRDALLECLAKLRETSEVTTGFFETLRSFGEEHPNVLHGLAACYEAGGRDVRAAEIYEKLRGKNLVPEAVALRIARNNARMQRHSPENLGMAERALEADPNDLEVALHVAAIRLETGQMRGAESLLNRMLASGNEAAAPMILSYLENSTRIATSQPDLMILLVRCYICTGRIDKALASLARLMPYYQRYFPQLIDCYTDIIAQVPDNFQARVERGILWRVAGHTQEALDDLEAAHRLAPDNAGIASEYADVLEKHLEEEGSRDAGAWARLGDLLFQGGEVDRAMEACIHAVESDSRNEASLFLLARVQLEAGGLDLCRDTLKKLPRTPKVFSLLQRLANAYEELGEHLSAAEVLAEALDVSGEQREVIEKMRALHLRRAEEDRRARSQDKVLEKLSGKARTRYELREEIGRGTMGLVLKAYDRELDEIVVLKILPEHFARNKDMLARFRNEAKAARKLAHPNIVRIHDIGEEDGRKHISMEYVSGGDLKQLIQEHGGPFSFHEALRMVREISRALVHAHGEGVLHRDIKPANILISRGGRVKLSDFGIAALIQEDAAVTRQPDGTEVIAGTPLYMSPEQFQGKPVGTGSDLYSLGLVFYELLAGHPPFTRGSISYHHQFTPPPPVPGLQEECWEIVEHLLNKTPLERFESAMELLDALDDLESGGRSSNSRETRRLQEEVRRDGPKLEDTQQMARSAGGNGNRDPGLADTREQHPADNAISSALDDEEEE